MKQNVLWALFTVCLFLVLRSDAQCYLQDLESCNFQYQWWFRWYFTWCGWTADGFTPYSWTYNTTNKLVGLSKNRDSGLLFRRLACATNEKTYCMKFRYHFDKDAEIYLKVYTVSLKELKTNEIWKGDSGSGQAVSNETRLDSSYIIFIEATQKRKSKNSLYYHSVYVDDISFSESQCASFTRNKPNTGNTTTTATTEKFDVVPDNTSMPNITQAVNNSSAEMNIVSQPSSVAIAILAVLLSIAICVIVFLLFILYRRGLLPCFPKAKPESEEFCMNVSHNAVYDLESSNRIVGEAASNIPRNGQNDPSADVSQASSTGGDYYSTIRSQGGSDTMPKTFSPKSDQVTGGFYHILEPTGSTRSSSGLENYLTDPNAAEKLPGAKTVAKPLGPTSAEKTEYSSLHHDRERKNVQGNTDGGAVYSHLQGGGEGEYNELDRTRRIDVIDGEYSHTQQK